jgi:topoisomerase-4 subunit A
VRSIDDFTAEVVAIELTLSANTKPARAIEALYAFTHCETSVSVRAVVIHEKRPVEMDIDAILRENTKQLVLLLKRELQLRKKQLLDDLHAKSLVQLFIEERIYKRIEECTTYKEVQQAVLDGLAPFRDRLRRDITHADVEMLLGIRIRRISLFDINKNRKDIDDILLELEKVEKHLADLTAYAIRYLKELVKQHSGNYPRRTRITTFDEIEVRELTARELEIRIDKEKGYLGHAVDGAAALQCSSYDKILLVWKDGKYKVIDPPEKVFVGDTMVHSARFDRDRLYTLMYTLDDFTYMKRFTFGGFILNKEYQCVPEGGEIVLFEDSTPEAVYVKYKPAKRQRIHQARFVPADVSVQNVKAKGVQMTAKAVARIATSKPRWWNDEEDSPRGVLMQF